METFVIFTENLFFGMLSILLSLTFTVTFIRYILISLTSYLFRNAKTTFATRVHLTKHETVFLCVIIIRITH